MAGQLVAKFSVGDEEIVVWHEFGGNPPYAVIAEATDGSQGVVLDIFQTSREAWKSGSSYARMGMRALVRTSEEAAGWYAGER